MCIQRNSTIASLLWPSHPGPVQSTDAAALKLLVHYTYIIMTDYYMAESVFAMRLVNLRSVTCYTDQNFNENAHFEALNLFTSEKRLKLSYKASINLDTLIELLLYFTVLLKNMII